MVSEMRAARVAPEKMAFRAILSRGFITGASAEEGEMNERKKSYSELLLDPRWQRRRLEILNRMDFHCEECGSAERTLHVHHRCYRRGAAPWEYTDDELVALCEKCHAQGHGAQEELLKLFSRLGANARQLAVGYVKTLLFVQEQMSGANGDRERLPFVNSLQAAGAAGVVVPSGLVWGKDGIENGLGVEALDRTHGFLASLAATGSEPA